MFGAFWSETILPKVFGGFWVPVEAHQLACAGCDDQSQENLNAELERMVNKEP